jgi:hypothetical protein
MGIDSGSILVFGNVTLDVICKTVDDVPRYDSIAFKDATGLVSALRRGKDLEEACYFGANQGALTTGFLGAARLDKYIEGL